MKKVVYIARSSMKENEGGGARRGYQIYKLLENSDFELEAFSSKMYSVKRKKRLYKIIYFFEKVRLFLKYRHLGFWSRDRLDYCLEKIFFAEKWVNSKDAKKKIDVLLIDDPIYFTPIIEYALRNNIRLVGVLQNIESLVDSQAKKNKLFSLFKKEIKILGMCNKIITISRYDALLLKNFHIKNIINIDYEPSEGVRNGLLRIKRKREKITKKDYFVVLGHMGNPPTYEGTLELLNYLQANEDVLKKLGLLVIAGFNAKKISRHVSVSNVLIKSDVDEEKLEDLLSGCKAVICHQRRATGALTKIPEMLIANIPVLCNLVGARNYYFKEGVVVYEKLEDISLLLNEINHLNERTISFSSNIPRERIDLI